jgi:hypothetical protein
MAAMVKGFASRMTFFQLHGSERSDAGHVHADGLGCSSQKSFYEPHGARDSEAGD